MKIIIADDHVIFRQGLRLMLESLDDTWEVIEAESYEQVLGQARALKSAGIIILDLNMPGLVRFTGISALRAKAPHAPVLVLSASEDADDVLQSLAAGASGYVAKSSDIKVVREAIRLVRSGGVFVPRDLLAGASDPVVAAPRAPPKAHLTQRQSEVLKLVSEGHANKEIAYRLGMSEGTVKAHLAAVMRQFQVSNRVQLLRAAERAGFALAR